MRTTETITYDPLKRRSTVTNGATTTVYKYDSLSRVADTDATVNGFPGPAVVKYTYDANGARSTMETLVGVVRYTYDPKGRLAAIDDPKFGRFSMTYDAMDRRTALQYPNGVTTSYAYDEAYRLTAMVSKNRVGSVLDAWSYQYDAVGNRTSKTDMTGKSEVYAYDSIYRLTSASYGDGSRESFTYDAVGNRMIRADESGSTTRYSYDVANQLLSAGNDTYTYDANGNTITKTGAQGTTTLTYDPKDRVRTISGPDGNETSVWATDGSRAMVSGSAVRTNNLQVVYDLTGNPILERDWSNGGAVTYRAYGPGIDEPLAEERVNGYGFTFLLHDALNSITAAADVNGNAIYTRRYRSFGQMSATGDNAAQSSRLGYTSRESSVGSLMQYRARYYDMGVGRFGTQDSYRGNIFSARSLHRYSYTDMLPTTLTDPSGHEARGVPEVNVFASIMIVASVIAIIGADITAIASNDYHTSIEMQSISAFMLNIVGVSAAFLYLQGLGAALVTLGLAVLGSASVIDVLANPENYTRCEVGDAVRILVYAMVFAAAWGIVIPGRLIDEPQNILSFEYLLIASMNLSAFGLTTIWTFFLSQRTARPFEVRADECRHREEF